MEVYFKELISKEASLEKLVEDLERVVQGADNFAKTLSMSLAEPRPEVARRIEQLKARCENIKQQIVGRAQATDRLVRKHPYSFVAGAAVIGMVVGYGLRGRK